MLNDTIGATPRRFQSPSRFHPRAKVFGAGRSRPLNAGAKSRLIRYGRAQCAAGRVSRAHFAVLYSLLFSFHNAASGRCFPSYARLAVEAGVSRSTAQLAVDALELLGLLVVCNRLQWQLVDVPGLGRQRRPRRTSNCYVFALPDVEAAAAIAASRPDAASAACNSASGASEGQGASVVALNPLSLIHGAAARGSVDAAGGSPRRVGFAADAAPLGGVEAALARLGRAVASRV